MPGGRPQLFDINSSVLNLILNAFTLFNMTKSNKIHPSTILLRNFYLYKKFTL